MMNNLRRNRLRANIWIITFVIIGLLVVNIPMDFGINKNASAQTLNDAKPDLLVGRAGFDVIGVMNVAITSSGPVWKSVDSWFFLNIGNFPAPAFADLDNDGDNDAIVGASTGISYGFENIGTSSLPVWEYKSSWNAPDIGIYSSPTLADLDNDNDYDLLIGETGGICHAYQNTGSVSSPIWTNQDSWNSPDAGSRADPALVDLDDDKDLDLLVGISSGWCVAYNNTGTVSSPSWTAKTSWNTPDIGAYAAPASVNLDSDSDYDLLLGSYTGEINAYRNTGSVTSPIWTAEPSWDYPDVGYNSNPALVNVDGDSYIDLMIGRCIGDVWGFINSGTLTSPSWTNRTDWKDFIPELYNSRTTPDLADLDNDGDLDLMLGDGNGFINGYENTGTASKPLWTANTAWNVGVDFGSNAAPSMADLDADGDYDLIAGSTTGTCIAYENTGSVTNPSWTSNSNWNVYDIGSYSSPELVDIDFDNDFDVMIGDQYGVVHCIENIGTVFIPDWAPYPPWDSPDVGDTASPALADVDNDGDFDMFIGNQVGDINAYNNTGTKYEPEWTAEPSWEPAKISYSYVCPTFANIDGDGSTSGSGDASVTVTSPNGGEDWMKGDYYPITWKATGDELISNPISIYYSTDNGDSWTIISTNEMNDGIYNWTVPNINTGDAIIRVDVTDRNGYTSSDTSDASFAIDPPPPSWSGSSGIGTDITPPEISHKPPTSLEGGKIQSIIVDVQDDKGVNSVNLYHRYSSTGSYQQVIMGSNGEQYIASFETQNIDGIMYYYIEAFDGTNRVTTQEYSVTIKATDTKPSAKDDTDILVDDESYEFTSSSVLYMILVLLVVVVIFVLIPKLYFEKPTVSKKAITKSKRKKK